jgi:transposase
MVFFHLNSLGREAELAGRINGVNTPAQLEQVAFEPWYPPLCEVGQRFLIPYATIAIWSKQWYDARYGPADCRVDNNQITVAVVRKSRKRILQGSLFDIPYAEISTDTVTQSFRADEVKVAETLNAIGRTDNQSPPNGLTLKGGGIQSSSFDVLASSTGDTITLARKAGNVIHSLDEKELNGVPQDRRTEKATRRRKKKRRRSKHNNKCVQAKAKSKKGRPVGTGRKLTPEQEIIVQNWIKRTSPSLHGIIDQAWSLRAITELISLRFGITIARRTVCEYLNRWGFTAKKYCIRSYKQDPFLVKDWIISVLPLIIAECIAEGGHLFYCDETCIQSDGTKGLSYAPCGKDAVVEGSIEKLKTSLIMALSPTGRMKYRIFSKNMNANLFIDFLRGLLRNNQGGKVFLIADNLRAHHAKKVQAWMLKHKDEIKIYFLPAYSPQLNPVEFLNNTIKGIYRELANLPNQERMDNRVKEIVIKQQRDPPKMSRLFMKVHGFPIAMFHKI